ncbi:MAG: L-aspartate oxidase [Thermoproteota archaeon]|nr:L-aspartate oxidase [Thermoproteota archaeon]
MPEIFEVDFLVIGSGIAGLSFAIQASKKGRVTIITKKELMESNTNLAQGGIAAVLGTRDSFKLHISDTLRVGCGLSNIKAVETLVENGPKAIEWLITQGVEFDKTRDKLALSMESGHSKKRIVHKGDYTGREIEEALVASLRSNDVYIFENCLALDLLTKDGRCYGAEVMALNERRLIVFFAKATILATGGIGQVYAQTSNPYIATGDGIAMAYRAGAKLEDMEFVQFHPTTLQRKGEPNFLISETVRGEGGILRNASGEAFMTKYDIAKELAPRDVVSRAVFEELKKGAVYLDLRHKNRNFIQRRFPTIYQECLLHGIDVAEDLIPVVPAEHYLCGGVKVDLNGESSIAGLFAFGECSCTGIHGANRLASNSLLESVVFSTLGVSRATAYLKRDSSPPTLREMSVEFEDVDSQKDTVKGELQSLMWEFVGVVRRTSDLTHALLRLQRLEETITKLDKDILHSSMIELRNMITIAKLITKAASIRKESRGTHYLVEQPKQDDENWLKHIVFENENVEIK